MMSKKEAIEIVQAIDLVGMSMHAHVNGHRMTPAVEIATIGILATVREQIAVTYGIDISPADAIHKRDDSATDITGRHYLTPAEAADEILKDLT